MSKLDSILLGAIDFTPDTPMGPLEERQKHAIKALFLELIGPDFSSNLTHLAGQTSMMAGMSANQYREYLRQKVEEL